MSRSIKSIDLVLSQKQKGTQGHFGVRYVPRTQGVRYVPSLDCGDGITGFIFVQTHRIAHIKYVWFFVCYICMYILNMSVKSKPEKSINLLSRKLR